jgi:hypothetical protein
VATNFEGIHIACKLVTDSELEYDVDKENNLADATLCMPAATADEVSFLQTICHGTICQSSWKLFSSREEFSC